MSEQGAVGRRALLVGAGATAFVAASLRATDPAAAKPPPALSAASAGAENQKAAAVTPGALLSGDIYRGVAGFSFHPEGSVERSYGGFGFHTVGGSGDMWALIDIPAGTRVRDIEWYASNSSGSTVTLYGRVWRPGQSSVASPVAVDATFSSAAEGVRSKRVYTSAPNFNLYPAGSRLALGFQSLNSFTQIAGARVGFAGGAGAVGLREVPYRAYDSRDPDKGKFASKENRLITLPGFAAPAGTAGVLVNVTAVGAAANGFLKIYSAAEAAPDTSSMNFFADGTPIANALVVGVSAARQLRIFASTSVHVIVDVLGTVS